MYFRPNASGQVPSHCHNAFGSSNSTLPSINHREHNRRAIPHSPTVSDSRRRPRKALIDPQTPSSLLTLQRLDPVKALESRRPTSTHPPITTSSPPNGDLEGPPPASGLALPAADRFRSAAFLYVPEPPSWTSARSRQRCVFTANCPAHARQPVCSGAVSEAGPH